VTAENNIDIAYIYVYITISNFYNIGTILDLKQVSTQLFTVMTGSSANVIVTGRQTTGGMHITLLISEHNVTQGSTDRIL